MVMVSMFVMAKSVAQPHEKTLPTIKREQGFGKSKSSMRCPKI
jgi:hypothetical protein